MTRDPMTGRFMKATTKTNTKRAVAVAKKTTAKTPAAKKAPAKKVAKKAPAKKTTKRSAK